MSEQPDSDAQLRAAFHAWAGARPESATDDAARLIPEQLADLVDAAGDDDARIAALDAALSSPQTTADLNLLLAAHSAARSAVSTGDAQQQAAVTGVASGLAGGNQFQPRPTPAWRRVLPLAAAMMLVVSGGTLWWQGRDEGVTRSGTLSASVELVGERGGALVWREVATATSYQLELLDSAGAVLFSSTTTDTVASLPPTLELQQASWWVRAFSGSREIGSSAMTQVR